MLDFLKEEANKTFTENGAVTNASTLSDCLDLFATVGALRHRSDEDINDKFARAYAENPDIAMKILFYARDIRGGIGERHVFRTIINTLADKYSESVKKNLAFIPEFGRYDDILSLFGTSCEPQMLELIKNQIELDKIAMEKGESISLLAKWLPSVNASNAQTVKNAKLIAKYLGMKDSQYRKLLSKLRAYTKIIENNLRESDYSFDYSQQPSVAMHKYRKAFIRNDKENYMSFLQQVAKGEKKLNTSALTPYQIIAPLTKHPRTKEERISANTTWNSLEDFTNDENALVVIDGSGSMYWYSEPSPASVALSLGIYYAERNKGAFHNHFITFSQKPQLVEIKGKDIVAKVEYCMRYNECANTNIQAVFELVLNTAVKNNVPQEEMPSTLYIVSDMEFDYCAEDASLTNFEYAKKLYEENGYELPRLVFWNVASRNNNQPVTKNEQGVALVSGCSPRIFSMLKSGKLTPYEYMMDILGNERYANIVA